MQCPVCIRPKISGKSFCINFPDHSRQILPLSVRDFSVVSPRSGSLSRRTEPWDDALLSREFTRNWIHSACTRARISRWILVFVASYVWRVVFLFVRAISARTGILNRGTRKCQSRQRHVRLQRVPCWYRQQAGARDATRWKRQSPAKIERQKKRGRIVSKLSFC